MLLVNRALAAAAMTALIASSTMAEDWTRFRGPNGSGVAESIGLPVEFGPDTNLEWAVEVEFARSSPVLAGDRIFLTSIDAEKFVTLAFDRSSGDELWRREIPRDRQTEMHQATDSATPSPVTDGANVYAFFQETGLVSYTASGEERWRMALGPFQNFYSIAASPILAGDALYLLCDQNGGSFLLAVDKGSGKELWRQERQDRNLSYTTPILYPDAKDPQEILVLGDRWLDAYDLKSGNSRWALGGLGVGPISSPILAGDLLIANAPEQGSSSPTPFSEMTQKHDANGDGVLSREEVESIWIASNFGWVDWDGNGTISSKDWNDRNLAMITDSWGIHGIQLSRQNSDPEVLWTSQQSVPYIPTGIVYDGVLYMVKDGIVSSLDPTTGELHKRGRLTKGSPKVYASPVAADGKIFVGTVEGQMAVLQAGAQWEVLALNELEDEIYATPAIADGHLFVRTKGKLFSFATPADSSAATSP